MLFEPATRHSVPPPVMPDSGQYRPSVRKLHRRRPDVAPHDPEADPAGDLGRAPSTVIAATTAHAPHREVAVDSRIVAP